MRDEMKKVEREEEEKKEKVKTFSFTIIAALAVAHPASCATASAPLVKFPEDFEKRTDKDERRKEKKKKKIFGFYGAKNPKKRKKSKFLTCGVQEGVPPEPVDTLHDDFLPRLIDDEAVLGGEVRAFGSGGSGTEGSCRGFWIFLFFGFFWRWAKGETKCFCVFSPAASFSFLLPSNGTERR